MAVRRGVVAAVALFVSMMLVLALALTVTMTEERLAVQAELLAVQRLSRSRMHALIELAVLTLGATLEMAVLVRWGHRAWCLRRAALSALDTVLVALGVVLTVGRSGSNRRALVPLMHTVYRAWFVVQ